MTGRGGVIAALGLLLAAGAAAAAGGIAGQSRTGAAAAPPLSYPQAVVTFERALSVAQTAMVPADPSHAPTPAQIAGLEDSARRRLAGLFDGPALAARDADVAAAARALGDPAVRAIAAGVRDVSAGPAGGGGSQRRLAGYYKIFDVVGRVRADGSLAATTTSNVFVFTATVRNEAAGTRVVAFAYAPAPADLTATPGPPLSLSPDATPATPATR